MCFFPPYIHAAGRDYIERENFRLTFSPNDTITFFTIVIVDGTEFRDDVTLFGVLSAGDNVGVSVGPDAMVTIREDERECMLKPVIITENLKF